MNNEATLIVIQELTKTNDITLFIPDNLDKILNAIYNGIEKTFYREVIIVCRIFMEYNYIINMYRTARI